jgi:saccharopine dehydrogenase-like NADP-dependent oxidoreductase
LTSVAVVGGGVTGARIARQLVEADDVTSVIISGSRQQRLDALALSLGPKASIGGDDDTIDVAVLAGPPGTHLAAAQHHLGRGAAIVSIGDGVEDVKALLDLHAEAEARGKAVVVGAGFAPGLSCVLARHAAAGFDQVDEVHVARVGTGGPACARQHHRALGGTALDWRDHGWQRRPGGSGRELCWFPDPIGAADCYRAELPDALLLVPAFPGVGRVTVRLAATRRDRLTAWMPMLRPPHPEGLLGALRVEVRGCRGPVRDITVLGAIDRPAVAAATTAATAARWVAAGKIAAGAAGLASLVDPVPFLGELAHQGVRAAIFDGEAA